MTHFQAGSANAVSFTHRGWRKAQKQTAARIKMLKFRRAECQRLGIDMGQYNERLKSWKRLRYLMQQRAEVIQYKTDQDALDLWLKERERDKITRTAEAEARTVLDEISSKTPYPDKPKTDKLAQNFGRILPPVS